MANVDQRKYLKKYLDDDQTRRRKKKSREHSSSRSERVRIVDDDGDYARAKKYDDHNDFILTGEDAPQIVGIVDDRPPELKAKEDFRNSSKWRSLQDTNDKQSRAGQRYEGNSQKYSDRRRSRSPIRRDYSPPRRPERREEVPATNSRKRRSEDDYSPVRRKQPDANSRPREASFTKYEKPTTYSNDSNARRREDYGRPVKGNGYGQYRDAETNHKEAHHEYQRVASYTRPQHANYAQRSQHDGRRPEYAAQNGRSAGYHPREAYHKVDYNRYPRGDTKPNPFRGASSPGRPIQTSHRDDYNRRRSPARQGGGGGGNPFRANPRSGSLSPLPERRANVGPSDGRPGVRMQKYENVRPRFESHSAKPSYAPSSSHVQHYDSSDRKSASNPFRGLNRSPSDRHGGIAPVRVARVDSAQGSYRSAVDKSRTQRPAHYHEYEGRRPETNSHEFRSYPKSRSPIKSGIQIVSSQPPRMDRKYQEKSDHTTTRYATGGGGSYPHQQQQQTYYPRKQAGHVSSVKY